MNNLLEFLLELEQTPVQFPATFVAKSYAKTISFKANTKSECVTEIDEMIESNLDYHITMVDPDELTW